MGKKSNPQANAVPLQPVGINKDKNDFYNAIRSGSIPCLDSLIKRQGDTDTSSGELDQIISCAYENLKLKNVLLTPEMEAYVENELIKLRFFSDKQGSGLKRNTNNIVERINLVTENITLLVSEYSDDLGKVDRKFLFILSFIAQNVHILKQQLRPSYNRLPWEEMEFILISFVVSHKKRGEENIFCHATLNKSKILTHLENFSNVLKDVKQTIYKSNLGYDLPKCKRKKIVAEIIDKVPPFQQLYDDYQEIRDVNSLMKINNYLVLALSVDCKEREGQLIITRVLQVIGEFLKNTLESPKLSDVTSELLLISLPKNTRDIIMSLRNSLSHAQSLSQRMEIEEKSDEIFYSGIQKDMKTINSVIDRILWNKKTELVRSLLNKIIKSESQDEMRDILGIFDYVDVYKTFMKMTLETNENNKLENLMKKLDESMVSKTDSEKAMFLEINELFAKVNSTTIKVNYVLGLFSFRTFYNAYRNHLHMKGNVFEQMKIEVGEAVERIPPPIDPEIVKKIIKLSRMICERGSAGEGCDDASTLTLAREVLFNAVLETRDLHWIESLKEKLVKDSFNRLDRIGNDVKTEEFQNLLEQKVLKLKSILKRNEVNQNSTTFKDKKKFQVIMEMLVLDIMSILSGNHLENNMLFLDDNAPLLTGKCLRNHLAHDNTILDVLLSDPTNALIFNAQKLVSEDVLKSDKKVGKLVRDDPNKLRSKYNQNLETVTNQEKLFAALEEGNLEKVKSCLDQGADIYGRSINLETALHFVARSSSIKILKFMLRQGLDMNARDSNGQNALHIAAAYGQRNILEYLVKEKRGNYRDWDNNLQTSLHIAARNGHKGIVDFLIEYNSDSTMQDCFAYTPLHYAIQHDRIGVINRLLEKQTVDDFQRSDNAPLHLAAANGSPEIVNLLLKKGASVDVKNSKNATPLHVASQMGNLGIVKTLVLNGADVNHASDDGYTPLIRAVDYGRDKVVSFLLAHKADVNVSGKTGLTALHFAALKGVDFTVQTLLKNNAHINSTDNLGITPLHFAAVQGHFKTVDLFIKNGAFVNLHAMQSDHVTPLHLAAREGHDEIAELLIKAGAEVDSKAYENKTPLHEAAIYGKTGVAEILIRNGAKVVSCDAVGKTPLHMATVSGSKDLIELLIKNNARVNVLSYSGLTPLHQAVISESVIAVETLIENGAKINVKDETSISLFHLAALKGQREIIEILHKNNAEVNAKSHGNITPLDMAVQEGHEDVVDCLLAIGAEVTEISLTSAVKCNRKEILETLISKGGDVEVHGAKLFLMAAAQGNIGIVELLLKRKVDVNMKDSDTGYTALYLAAVSGHTKVVRTLLENGAEVNPTDRMNNTPLNVAVLAGHQEIVKMLIAKGGRLETGRTFSGFGKIESDNNPFFLAVAQDKMSLVKELLLHNAVDINARTQDLDGFTALHIAVENNNLKMVEYLVSKGSDLHARNGRGTKPIHVAARDGFIELVQFFLNKGMNVEESGLNKRTLFHYAATKPNNMKMFTFLMCKGSVVDAQDSNGVTPLHLAAYYGSKNTVKFLLDSGTKYNVTNMLGETPYNVTPDKNIALVLESTQTLFKAVKENNPLKVKELIPLGASVNARNSDGATPLHFAAWKGFEKVVDILLDNEANPNAKGKGGVTPLHYACKFSHLKIVQALLRRGARFNAVHDNGKTPLNFGKDKDVVSFFKTVEEAFENVKKGNTKVINDLNKLEMTMLKAVMGAQNENGRTLIAVAIGSNFPKLEDLKQVRQLNATSVLKAIEIAKVLIGQNKYEMAFQIINKIYQERKEVLGPENPATLEIQMHLADLKYKNGALLESLRLYEEIIEKQKSVLEDVDSNDILNTRGRAALVLHRLERNQEAYEIFKDVHSKQTKLLGDDHPDTMTTESHFGLVLQAVGKLDEALKINTSQYEARKRMFGENNQSTICMHNNIALVLHQQGKQEEALQIFREVYARKKKVLGIEHADTMRTLRLIAGIFCEQNQFGEALTTLKEALKAQEKALGKMHPETLLTRVEIAETYLVQQKITEALENYQDISGAFEAVHGPNHPCALHIKKRIILCKNWKQGPVNFNVDVFKNLLKEMT